jgi:hypothetical protein
MPADHLRSGGVVRHAGDDDADAHDICEGASGLFETPVDVGEGLLRLIGDVVGDFHRVVVETGTAGHEDPAVIVDDDTRIVQKFLEVRSPADPAAHRAFSFDCERD